MTKVKQLQSELTRLWNWCFSKKDEVFELSYKDAFMAHIVLEIMTNPSNQEFVYAPLNDLHSIHPVDNRENTIEATKKRTAIVEKEKTRLLALKQINKETIAEILPSATYIRAVKNGENGYYTFEGNGRVAALQNVLSSSDGITIELDLFTPRKPRRVLRYIRKLRKLHGMKKV